MDNLGLSTVQFTDPRKVDSKKSFTQELPVDNVVDYIRAAKEVNVNPFTAIALAIKESNAGTATRGNGLDSYENPLTLNSIAYEDIMAKHPELVQKYMELGDAKEKEIARANIEVKKIFKDLPPDHYVKLAGADNYGAYDWDEIERIGTEAVERYDAIRDSARRLNHFGNSVLGLRFYADKLEQSKGDEYKALKRYNGGGKAVDSKGRVISDSDVNAKTVIEFKKALEKNPEIQKLVKQHMGLTSAD